MVNSKIEVVFATPDEQHIVALPWEPGMTAEAAVQRSGLLVRHALAKSNVLVLGVFGRRIAGSDLLHPGDRVEICRPLVADPRQMRRSKVAHGHVMGGEVNAKPRKQQRA